MRSPSGNLTHIHQRIASHKRSLASVLYACMFTPSLLCELRRGSAPRYSSQEWPPSYCPDLIFLISVSLPVEAILHLRQLFLFLMVCRLASNILHVVTFQELLSPASEKTRFGQMERVCPQYTFLHPLQLLNDSSEKESLKKTVKLKIADCWKQKYVAQNR